ncbi:MAG TPA: type II toxin-antitoxin system VapC family toxin [Silvibacterium sp.]|nr:type II toxin-antitoxin system VapC family toxin [Silvibacterium sp.]
MTILIDSDVLIEVCRGRNVSITTEWLRLVASGTQILYSAITAAELWAGALPSEQHLLRSLFQAIACVSVDYESGQQAGEYLRRYQKSHGVGIGDALIAAAAVQNEAALWTRNRKHYPMKEIDFYQGVA